MSIFSNLFNNPWEESLLALNSVLLKGSACQILPLVNRKLFFFPLIFLQGAFPCNGIKWKDTFCLSETSISSLHE